MTNPAFRDDGGQQSNERCTLSEPLNEAWDSLDEALNNSDSDKLDEAEAQLTTLIDTSEPENVLEYTAYFKAVSTNAYMPVWRARTEGRQPTIEEVHQARNNLILGIEDFPLEPVNEAALYYEGVTNILLLVLAMGMRNDTLPLPDAPYRQSSDCFGLEYPNRFYQRVSGTPITAAKDDVFHTSLQGLIFRGCVDTRDAAWYRELNEGRTKPMVQRSLVESCRQTLVNGVRRRTTDHRLLLAIRIASELMATSLQDYVSQQYRGR